MAAQTQPRKRRRLSRIPEDARCQDDDWQPQLHGEAPTFVISDDENEPVVAEHNHPSTSRPYARQQRRRGDSQAHSGAPTRRKQLLNQSTSLLAC
eukprot:5639664-Amphidinium_carterae.2